MLLIKTSCSLRIMLPPTNVSGSSDLIRCPHSLMRAGYVARVMCLHCSVHPSVLCSGSLLRPMQYPVKHHYYAVCGFSSLNLVKYAEHESAFYSVKLRVCVVCTRGQQEVMLRVLKLAGVVMDISVGMCLWEPNLIWPCPWCC